MVGIIAASKFAELSLARYKIRKNFLIAAILTSGLISAFIALVAYFGLNMGTFVISLDEKSYTTGISLSADPEFPSSYPRLLIKPQQNCVPVTYSDLKLDEISATDGDYIDPTGLTYIAYTFYLKNEGTSTVDLSFQIEQTMATLGIESAVRVLVIENETNVHCYWKNDGTEKSQFEETPDEIMNYFYDEQYYCNQEILNFKPGQINKYSVVLWLEGWDHECIDNVIGAKLKIDLKFAVTHVLEEE